MTDTKTRMFGEFGAHLTFGRKWERKQRVKYLKCLCRQISNKVGEGVASLTRNTQLQRTDLSGEERIRNPVFGVCMVRLMKQRYIKESFRDVADISNV